MDIAEIRKKAKNAKSAGQRVPGNGDAVTAPGTTDVRPPSGLEVSSPLEGGPAEETLPAQLVPALPEQGFSPLDRLFSGIGGEQFASEESYQTALVSRGVEDDSETNQFLAFQLGSEEYALDINRISEIIKPRDYTDIPRVPDYILGLVSLRGVVVPIFDLRQRFQMGRVESGAGARIIVCRDGEITAGLLVDKINQVVRIAADRIEPPPAGIGGIDRSMITGIGRYQGRMIILLNLASVLEIVSG